MSPYRNMLRASLIDVRLRANLILDDDPVVVDRVEDALIDGFSDAWRMVRRTLYSHEPGYTERPLDFNVPRGSVKLTVIADLRHASTELDLINQIIQNYVVQSLQDFGGDGGVDSLSVSALRALYPLLKPHTELVPREIREAARVRHAQDVEASEPPFIYRLPTI